MSLAPTVPAAASFQSLPWIRNAQFDLGFIVGLLGLACLTGATVLAFPALFWPVLVVDLWFLGYHHVMSTYSRICFDRKSFRENGWLIYVLMPAVAAATMILPWQFGLWSVVTVCFYWQWFHYTRQSWGISRTYRSKDREKLYEDGWLDQAIFYALPVTGVLSRSNEDPKIFINLELWALPVPDWMFNSRRFKEGVDPEARFLSYLSQPGRLWLYLFCFVVITGVSATIVIYQVLNFNHYVVNSLLWKVRKPQFRATLGIQ